MKKLNVRHWVVFLSLALIWNNVFIPSAHGEELTTLDGQTFTNITELTKYPKLVVFTYNGNRKPVQNTNLPQDFRDKYKIVIQTNKSAVTAVITQPKLSPDDLLLIANKDLVECDYYLSEKSSFVTNRYSQKVYRDRSWQMCLRGTEVSLTFYGSEDITNETTQSIHFLLGQESIVKQSFEKFIEWNQIATTNKAEPFEKLILQCPDPNNILNYSGLHTFTFRWDLNLYGGAAFYDSVSYMGGFDIDSVTRFQELLNKLPDLKTKVLEKIHNREAQKALFK